MPRVGMSAVAAVVEEIVLKVLFPEVEGGGVGAGWGW